MSVSQVITHCSDPVLQQRLHDLLLDSGFATFAAELDQIPVTLSAFPNSLLLLQDDPAAVAWLRGASQAHRARVVLLVGSLMPGTLHWHPYVVPGDDLDSLPERLRARFASGATTALAPIAAAEPAAGPRGELLIVDDDPGVRDYLIARLTSEGYRCVGAGDGLQAVRAIEQSVPDVILLDLNMPGMDGMAFLSLARHHAKSAFGVIVLTGGAGHRVKEQVQRFGAFALLPKPVDFPKLLRLIEIQMDYRLTRNRIRQES